MVTAPRSRTPATARRTGHTVAEWVHAHPRTIMAFKAAFAAGAAWMLVIPLGGVADDYAYYAPLGAVVVMSTTVMTSVRTGLQAIASIGIGAALALLVKTTDVPTVIGIVALVGIGTALANWKRLGAMGVWVPFAALFVLVLSGSSPWTYVLGYAGLTAVGAAVGIAVNLAAPQLPLGRTLQAVIALRDELSTQLRSLADDLMSADDLGTTNRRIHSSVAPPAGLLEQLVTEVRESRRGNWRAGRWRQVADRREEQARALETMAYLVEEVGALLSRSSSQLLRGRSRVGDAIAEALRCTADMLEATQLTGSDDQPAPSEEARASIERLREVTLSGELSDDAVLVGSSVTVSLQRALEAWE